MSNKGKKSNGLNIALTVLLITWVILLVLLITVFVMRMQGYEDFQDFMNRKNPPVTEKPIGLPEKTPAPTDVPTKALTPTITPTATPAPSNTPTDVPQESPSPTLTVAPTETPTPTPAFLEALSIADDAVIDADICRQAILFAGDANIELVYEVYQVENYLSVVFHKVEETAEEAKEVLLPLVYDRKAKKQVSGSDFIKESYFAIIKERLQAYVAEKFPASAGTDFITYAEIYQEKDYQKFYLTGEKLVFWFEENSLLSEGQEAFLYEVPLAEAEAFLKYNLDGSKKGIAIRELDPDKPMVAFTFDDGPHFQKQFSMNNLDTQLVTLFEKYDGRATFFFLGSRVGPSSEGNYLNTYGKIARTVYEAGFEVASHTHTHDTKKVQFYSDSDSQKPFIWQEFNSANLAIAMATGCAPDYIRLPGGSVGKWTKEFPVPIINWDIDSVDYKDKKNENGGALIYERLKEADIKDGSIILLHSIYQTTYDAVEMLLPYLAEQGYQFVTLSELFYYKGINPEDGVVYSKAWTAEE